MTASGQCGSDVGVELARLLDPADEDAARAFLAWVHSFGAIASPSQQHPPPGAHAAAAVVVFR